MENTKSLTSTLSYNLFSYCILNFFLDNAHLFFTSINTDKNNIYDYNYNPK